MKEKFQEANRFKLEIETKINDIYNSKEFVNIKENIDPEKFYSEKIKVLEETSNQIKILINHLLNSIEIMKNDLVNKKSTNEEDNYKILWQRKIQNLESQTKDLTQYLRKAYLFRLDLLNSEKNKYELYGKRNHLVDEEYGIKILIKEQDTLKNSLIITNESKMIGQTIISSLKFQNDTIKNIQKKVYSVLNEAGLSNTMSKLIERRSRNDLYILIFCFSFLLLIIFTLFYYIRPLIRG